ncbi:amidase family protein [Meiothermus sp.]|uniref:amidase family protein n=1 Tax=Meiothermus sp. TaxID=1955249 RepID=UPI0021DEF95A|nr:amidase family protein [Meiothermus sp.]GIW33559.1 MAG: amidase [Meiothermus sp.]
MPRRLQLFSALVFLGLGLVVWWAMSQAAEKRLNPNKRDWESFVARQVAEQTAEHSYPLRRPLDFGPFEAALAQLETPLLEHLQTLTQQATIPELQAEMQAGRLTSEQLTLFYLWRIRRYNDRLRAYLELNPAVLEEARARDAERRQGKLRGVLHGIPLSLKDNISTVGPLHTTAGAAVLAEHMADQDAFIVQKLRAAGAVILGKNNLSEWANFMTSQSVNGYSTLGGHTRNPYGPFDVGGSSSGTAVAVAANLAVAGIGSETSGSLIYPAAQNSVFTLKPTLGLVSRDRIIPITAAQDTAGPMTKSAADLAVLMSVIAGHDPTDTTTEIAARFSFPATPPAFSLPLRVGWVQHTQRKGDAEALAQVAQVLSTLGVEVVEVPFSESSIQMMPVLHAGMRRDLARYLQTTGAAIRGLQEVIEYNRQHPEAMRYGQDLLEASLAHPFSEAEYEALVSKNHLQGSERLLDMMQTSQVEVLLTVSNSLSVLTSTSGFPVVNLPAGYRESGEPVGASLVAQPLQDPLLIGLAQAVADQLNIHKPPVLP